MKTLFVAILLFLVTSAVGYCDTEESLYLDNNPRYSLVLAREDARHYLDLESCTLLSGDEDGFEISVELLTKSESSVDGKRILRFKKNVENGWQLHVLPWYRKAWAWMLNPYDEEAVKMMLDAKGKVSFWTKEYYIFRLAYQHLFGKPYEDGRDEEEARRSALIFRREKSLNIHHYLWDNDNYPCISRYHVSARYLDKSSIYVEMGEPPQYILHALVLKTPQLHYNDIMPDCMEAYRILYDKDEGAMYQWLPQEEEWYYLAPEKKNNGDDPCVPLYVGEAAFYLTYGERFYDVAPMWFHRRNPWFNKNDDEFYERLDGETA